MCLLYLLSNSVLAENGHIYSNDEEEECAITCRSAYHYVISLYYS